MILSYKRITKALIRLRGCAGWSAPLLFADPRRQVFSRRGLFNIVVKCVNFLNEVTFTQILFVPDERDILK